MATRLQTDTLPLPTAPREVEDPLVLKRLLESQHDYMHALRADMAVLRDKLDASSAS